jgi:ADP-ribosyl-[dinitrogen reductase] hydrolase|uniref:ADP-ribosylglycohydrolase family protein n=1 Tax=Thermomicrobium roseum TaxID=500 RepID=A0A7C1XDC9_THERO
MNEQLRDRFRGCLLGLAVGDALGATVEFMSSAEIQQRFGVHRDIIGGGWLRLKPGEHTDDTDMTLCVARSIVACGRVEPADIAQRFVAWLATGPKDVGGTVRQALDLIAHGVTWREAGQRVWEQRGEHGAGNGSLMRTAPIALFHAWRPDELIADSLAVSQITHAHPVASWSCVALGQAIAAALRSPVGTPTVSLLEQAAVVAEPRVAEAVREAMLRWPEELPSKGFVLHTLQLALTAVYRTNSFEDAVVRVVNRGGDADTAGAVTGALAGALYGAKAIPERWLTTLRAREELEHLADQLLALALPREIGTSAQSI